MWILRLKGGIENRAYCLQLNVSTIAWAKTKSRLKSLSAVVVVVVVMGNVLIRLVCVFWRGCTASRYSSLQAKRS